MWPLSSQSILDQAAAQSIQPQALSFGALSGGGAPSASPQPQGQQGGINRILSNPVLMQALGRMGSAISSSNSTGAGFGASLAAGFGGFNESVAQQGQEADQKRLRDAQIAQIEARTQADSQDAQYGVQSSGFEGDIARARVILNDPMSTDRDKAIAEAVIQTAERMVGGYDPVNGDYRMNPKAQIGGSTTPASALRPQVSAASEEASTGMLLPPPSTGSAQDMSLFSTGGTGNRKVDAALQEEAGKAEIAGRRTVNEGVGKVDSETFGQIANQTRTLSSMLPQLQRIETLAANTKTGGVGVARLELGKLFGLDLDGVPEAQAITAIQNAIGPSLRTPGSGSSSDKDVAIFMSSIPTLMNTPGGIAEINKTYSQLLERKKKEEGIARKLLREEGNLERFYDETEKLGPVFKAAPNAPSAQAAPTFDRSAIEAEMRRRMLK